MRAPDLRRLRRPEKAEEKFLGPLEAEVMDRLWKRRSATVRDIVEDLARSRELAYTTVMTIMVRLQVKGLLEPGGDGIPGAGLEQAVAGHVLDGPAVGDLEQGGGLLPHVGRAVVVAGAGQGAALPRGQGEGANAAHGGPPGGCAHYMLR